MNLEDDQLDELLSQATWPEADAQSTQRLWKAYQRHRWTRAIPALSALAAAAMVVVVWTLAMRENERVDTPAVIVQAIEPVKSTPTMQVIARAPTLQEQYWMRVAASTENPPPVQRREDPRDLLRRGLAASDSQDQIDLYRRSLDLAPEAMLASFIELLINPDTTINARQALITCSNPPIDGLFDRLNDPRMKVRLAVAEILGRIDGPQTTARLAAMAQANVHRREALIALLHNSSPQAAGVIVAFRADPLLAAQVHSLQIQFQNEL